MPALGIAAGYREDRGLILRFAAGGQSREERDDQGADEGGWSHGLCFRRLDGGTGRCRLRSPRGVTRRSAMASPVRR